MGKSHFVWLSFAFLGFAVLVAAILYLKDDVKFWYTYERHAANVVVSVSAANDFCATEENYPIWVSIENGSSRPLESTVFRFVAKIPGHSSNIVLGGYSFTDQIVQPGYRLQQCHAVPQMWDYRDRDARAARTFDWSLEDVRFKFGD
jgi:hypothetical protein